MTAPDPRTVITELLGKHTFDYEYGQCHCGFDVESEHAENWHVDFATHQAEVLAADPRIAIVGREGMARIYRAASTLGQRYMLPQQFGTDLEEAQRWYTLQQSALDGLPGVDTVRLEYRDELLTDWEPLVAGGES